MEHWNFKRYEQEKRSFIQRRLNMAPLWSQFALLFAVSWGAAWFSSWLLLHFFAPTHAWAKNLPVRYAIAFMFAYACFFLAVRAWIEIARTEPHQQSGKADISSSIYPDGSEGCLVVVAVLILGFIVGGLLLVFGGAPMLLEVAFEAAFAGVVVTRPIAGNLVLGDWKLRLLANTWKQALLCLLGLIMVAAWLQSQAPEAATFAEAIHVFLTHNSHAPL